MYKPLEGLVACLIPLRVLPSESPIDLARKGRRVKQREVRDGYYPLSGI